MEATSGGFSYGDAEYWDARYLDDDGAASSFDWYQRYSALRPFVRSSVPLPARVLVVGCGNAVMSEDMVKDGYEDIMNIDISPVAIEIMKRKYAHIPQLKYMQMDVRNMSYFPDEYFDSVIDKGTLDSLMCGFNARISASQMLEEVSRILRPGGVYILITYGDPSVRIPHLNHSELSWEIALYILPRPGFHKGASSSKPVTEPVPLTESGLLPPGFVLEDPDSHYIYVCKKMEDLVELNTIAMFPWFCAWATFTPILFTGLNRKVFIPEHLWDQHMRKIFFQNLIGTVPSIPVHARFDILISCSERMTLKWVHNFGGQIGKWNKHCYQFQALTLFVGKIAKSGHDAMYLQFSSLCCFDLLYLLSN